MRKFYLLIIFLLAANFLHAQLRYALIPENPRSGEPVTIGVNSGVTEAVLLVNGRTAGKAPFFFVSAENGKPGFLAAVLTIPSTVDDADVVIKLISSGESVIEIPVNLDERKYTEEVIYLNPSNTSIRTDPNPQRVYESELLWKILTTTGDTVYHTGPFLPPTTATRRTSVFGSRRIYQYSTGGRDTSIHAGVDYGIPKGSRVDACGGGRVVLAAMRIVTGNTVVIEHAPGIYSLYYHMDSIDVKESDIVKTGTQVGLSGSTGLSTGPHLHWEIRVNAENTDPDAFVMRQIIDKKMLVEKIYFP